MRKKKLVQLLRVAWGEGEGEFEPQGEFLKLDGVEQIYLLNDWVYAIEQYLRHLMVFEFLKMAKVAGDEGSWEQKLLAFRRASDRLGFLVQDDFEDFVDAHLDCKVLPIKLESCPICNPQD
jgi:hypothetical protein